MKYLVSSTKVTEYETIIEADSREHLDKILSGMIEDDFTPMHGEWVSETITELEGE